MSKKQVGFTVSEPEIIPKHPTPNPFRVKTNFNGMFLPKERQRFTQPSETVPDQALTVNEILERFSRGMPVTGTRQPIYHGDEVFVPEFKTLDLADIEEMRDAARNTLKDGETAYERRKLREAYAKGKKAGESNSVNPKTDSDDKNNAG